MKKITLLTLLITLLFCAAGLAEEFAMIVNKDNQSSTLSKSTVHNIFLGKKSTWPDGTPIVLLTQKNMSIHEAFTAGILNKSTQQFDTYWKKALFTGTGIPPQKVEGDAEMLAMVAANKGSIGYVSKGSLNSGTRVVEIR